MAEEKAPEEEERFRRLLEGLKEEKPKEEKPKEEKPRGVRVKFKKSQITLVAIGLAAILGAYEFSMGSAGAFKFNDVVIEGKNATLFADRMIISGLQLDNENIDNRYVSVQSISELQITNLRIRKVDAEGTVEIKEGEVNGAGIIIKIIGIPRLCLVRLDNEDTNIPIENMPFEQVIGLMEGLMETVNPKSWTFENLEIQFIYMSVKTMTASGMEINVS